MNSEKVFNLVFNIFMSAIPAIFVVFSEYVAFSLFVFAVVFLLHRIADLLMGL